MYEYLMKFWSEAREQVIQDILNDKSRIICKHFRGKCNTSVKACRERYRKVKETESYINKKGSPYLTIFELHDIECEYCHKAEVIR